MVNIKEHLEKFKKLQGNFGKLFAVIEVFTK